MNEEALKDAYNLFVQQGYKKSIDDFKQLIASNPDALKDSYNLFAQQGYTKTIDDYKTLIGVSDGLKKKEEPILPMAPQQEQVPSAIPGVQPYTGSPLEGTSSELPSPISEEQPVVPKTPVTPSYVEPTPVQPEQGPLGTFNQKITGPDYGGQLTPEEQARAVKIQQPAVQAEPIQEEKQGYWSQLADQAVLGVNQLDKMVASIPEAVYNILAIPQNAIAWVTGLDIATSADKFGKDFGIENIVLKKLNEEQDELNKSINKFNVENYEKTGIYDNIKDGNYSDAFQLLGSGITQSVPVSLAMMLGGATLSAAELTAAGTIAFSEGSREQLNETAPNMPEIEKTLKSLAMASAETVFSQVGTGTIGKVYKDIIKKEGLETGKVIFRNGLVDMYKTALKKYGAPVGLLGEGIEEVATQVTQNVISGKPAFEGAADAFIVGGGSGVVFATPITVMKAKDNIKNIVETNNSKSEIKTILKDKPSELHQIFNVPQAEPFTPEQIQIANTNKSRDILVKNLDKNVKDGVITSEDAKQSVYIFDKAQQVSNAVKDLDVSIEKKTEVANLLSKRNDLKTKIENKEDVLVVKEKQQIDQINKQISDIILEPKTEQNAIQEQAADESVLRSEQSQVGLQEVVEGNVQPEVTTTRTEEVVAEQPKQEEVAVPEIKRESIRLLTDEEVNPLYDEIPMNLLPIADNVSKQDAVFDAYFKSKQNNTNPELIKVVESSLIKTPVVSLKTQEVAPIEVEQYVPITEKEVRHEAFTRDNAIDYEEDYKTGDNGREYSYISSLTVELTDNDGNSIGNLIKLVDEDGVMSFQAEDIDGNELSLNGFDTKGEAKKALVDKWNKTQKKEFDKEAKKKVKEAKKTTKKQANETLQSERVQPKSGIVRPESKIAIKPTGLAIPSQPYSKREEVKKSIQEIANSGLLRSAETGKSTITEEEIDVQMALNDAMARVWKETTGKDNFYETFIEDIKQGDIDAIVKKGGALFQNVELPQLPITRVTLAVFDLPEFQKMNGISVAPQSISDLMKSRGKQIEKDIINTVLSYDKYKGQKRIPFDEFRDDVETQLMKLERINTTTYASYGKDNLGDNHTYGEAQTIIFNSPIDHGEYGHFRNDFFNNRLTPKTWEIRQVPNTEQYVAIDSEMPSGTPANEMSNYIGTAGPRVDVDKWINDRNSIANKEINKGLFGHIRNWFNRNTGVYTLAELQSDYYQKNKANDLYASQIPQDEVNEYVNKNFRKKLDNETTEAIKKEFGIFLKYDSDPEGNTIVSAFSKSNPDALLARNTYAPSYVPLAGFTLADVSENQTVIEALRSLANQYNNVSERRREVIDEYEAKRLEIKKEENKYIAKRIEEIKKSESGNLMLSQFVASQKVHELRLFREALKHAADKGAEELWFPTPYTLAKIEGYVSSNGNAPYDIITGDESRLEPGDIIDYGGTKMTVVESSAFSITVAPSDEVSIYNTDDLRSDEVNNRMSELEYDLTREVTNISSITKEEAEEYKGDDYLFKYIVTELKEYFQNNPEKETVSWDDIEDKVKNYVEDYYYGLGVQDLISWAADVYEEGDVVYAIESARRTERLSQPSEYESDTNEDDFEDNLSDEQSTVVKKYGELNQMIKKMRPDAEVITDGNDNKWIKTTITNADATNPIIAFQNEGGKIKGAIDFSNDNKASIYIFDGADISTLTHEMSGHLGRRVLEKLASIDEKFSKDYKIAQKWAGVKNNQWTLTAEEKWARGFERYLRSGKAPSAALTNVFKKLQNWLTNIYKSIKGSSIDIKLTNEITSVFDNLLATKKETTLPAEEQGIANELMNLDVNDEDSLKRILDALDRVDENISKKLFGGANESLLAIPLGTVQLVIKSLKVLVKGGMLLRDAIRKVAADNNLSQESIKDILNIAPIQEGFNSVMSKVDAMIERQKRRGVEEKRIISNVDTLVRNEDVYKNADDAQKKILEREARVKLGAKPRRAPSIGRVLGVLKGIANVSREDKLKVIKEIRELSRDATRDLAKEIRSLGAEGTITVNQAADIVAKFGKVNMLSEISVSNFVDYISNVFKDAEYQSKLNNANKLKSSIKKLSKNADKNANLRDLGQQFVKIDPSIVEDIDSYNEMASKINEAIEGSSIRKQKVNFAETVDIENASKYIEKTLDAQDKIIAEKRISEIQNLMGVDASEFSAEEMLDLLKGDESITKYNEGIVRDTINKAFQVYSAIIKNTIKTGKDAFTGEDVEFTKSEKELVGKFMDMDLNVLTPKDALKAVDALTNFLQNHSIAKMDAVVSQYTALVNGDKLVQKGVKARELKKYWSSQAGRFLAEQTTTLPILFEKMFPGFNRSGYVMDMIGLTKLISKTSYAKTQAKNIVNDYIGKFYKKEANGEAFNTAYNNIERGMASKLIRTVIGTEAEMQKEFDRRKELIEQSIEDLSNGDDKEQAMAELYQKAYDKLNKATNIQEIRDRVDKTNLEAVDFWIENWANKYEQFAQVSAGVYNILLEKDLNYTPDKLSLLSSYSEDVELNNEESAFHKNSGELYDRESGVLMKTTKPNAKDIKKASRYLDLSFDKNMSNSMYDALIDVNTAASIKQINAFLNSPNFDKIFPNKKDAAIIKGNKKNIGRLQLYVNNIRGKNHFTDDELSSVMRKFDKMAAIGVGQALGTLSQPFKQVIPIAVNTLINSGSLPDMGAITNIDKFNFISNSGEAIANRGAQSQFEIESINKLITEASTSTGSKALDLIEKANAKLIDYLLVKPDIAIARASWLSYYEQSLKQQGVDVNGLDYSKHEKNDEAANFAQRQVDRQQNVSDHDLSGKLFSSKDTSTKILVKTLMSFASFRMNASSRVGADLTTLNDKTSTAEDRLIAARSLAGYGAELATFKIVSLVATVLIGSLTKMIMGDDEDEEDYNKRVEKAMKSQRSSVFSDIFSPLPIADPFIQQYVAKPLLDKVEEFTGAPVSIYGSSHKETLFSSLGTFGIAFDRASKIIDLGKLTATGKYTDDFGKEHTISESKRESLKPFVPLAVLASMGVIPQEGNTLAMNAMKYVKAKSSTPEEKIAAEEKATQKEESVSQKVDALEKVRTRTRKQSEYDAIDKKINELEADTEEKKVIKEENAEEKLQKKELLTNPVTGKEYDNESELKRYNPRLYNKNFGIRSQWYKDHKAEKAIDKKMNLEIRKMEDKENRYRAPVKQSKTKNSDGSYKRSSYRRYSSSRSSQ